MCGLTKFWKFFAGLSCFILIAVCLGQTVGAQSEEELLVLNLFYSEKDLVVQSATRHPKHISQIAENISVVTAKEIEAMNAHTVGEVLNRIPGIFVSSSQEFGAASIINIQGSQRRHVLVLIDGFSWNPMSNGAVTIPIPVGIIERIEIIKGPASSAWGSSLGGVVNIITKSTGDAEGVSGVASASYGKSKSQDYRAEIRGKARSVGYYLFAGHQESDGLIPSRGFDSNSFYSKFDFSISKDTEMGASIGYSEPSIDFGDYLNYDITVTLDTRALFASAFLNTSLTENLELSLSAHTLKMEFMDETLTLGLGIYGDTAGEFFTKSLYDDQYSGGSVNLVWEQGTHTLVMGADMEHVSMDKTTLSGAFYQDAGVPATIHVSPGVDRWAIYANDTISLGNWSLTPGIRYDYNEVSGSFISPSMGLTYRMDESSIFRASVSRGFSTPSIEMLSGGTRWLDPNPSLEPEEIWSYQAGVESCAAKYFWAKATYFYHDMEKALYKELYAGGPPSYNDMYFNKGNKKRQGVEIEIETLPFHNLSLLGGFAYVDADPPSENGEEKRYTYNIGIKYDDKDSFKAQLFGHHEWWDIDSSMGGKYNDFIWDLNLSKTVFSKDKIRTELFLTAHNIFNASQYDVGDAKNPERWMEAGLRFKF